MQKSGICLSPQHHLSSGSLEKRLRSLSGPQAAMPFRNALIFASTFPSLTPASASESKSSWTAPSWTKLHAEHLRFEARAAPDLVASQPLCFGHVLWLADVKDTSAGEGRAQRKESVCGSAMVISPLDSRCKLPGAP